MSDMEKEITELQRKQNTTVIFSAYIDTMLHPVTTITRDTVYFNGIFVNVGNGYNPTRGYFVAPVSGYYIFYVHIHNQNDKPTRLELMVKDDTICAFWAEEQTKVQSPSCYVGVFLKQGDKVDVKAGDTSYVWSSFSKYSTFSGHLVNQIY